MLIKKINSGTNVINDKITDNLQNSRYRYQQNAKNEEHSQFRNIHMNNIIIITIVGVTVMITIIIRNNNNNNNNNNNINNNNNNNNNNVDNNNSEVCIKQYGSL